ncbi:MAG: ATP-binding protein [Clostridiales bacterium]|nr:ATP-binding protein [Clostridiales bacterium]
MAYNSANVARLRQEFEAKHLRAIEDADRRTAELYVKLPELRAIDSELAGTGVRIMRAINGQEGHGTLDERINQVRSMNEDLQKLRNECLTSAGYPSDYTDPVYECPACQDYGFVDTRMCVCLKRALVMAGYESSGIGRLIETQSFDTFSLDYYSEDTRALENMRRVLALCKDYAENFGKNGGNLLLCGATGLGKTHLSTSIAKVIIENGYDVVYDTASNIFADFEYERFSRSYSDTSEVRTARYFACELLIMDDLGTEVSNQFTISCLYNLINTRINNGRWMIINTNLTRDELRRRYADRITSRLFGEFSPLMFYGRDIRAQKLAKQ